MLALLERADTQHRFLRRTVVIGLTTSVLGGVPGALIGVGARNPAATAGGVVITLHVLTGLAGGLACLLERAGRPGPADHLLRRLVHRG